ncbi:hypothetical protein Efla_001079 [Eimeria flavescens]
MSLRGAAAAAVFRASFRRLTREPSVAAAAQSSAVAPAAAHSSAAAAAGCCCSAPPSLLLPSSLSSGFAAPLRLQQGRDSPYLQCTQRGLTSLSPLLVSSAAPWLLSAAAAAGSCFAHAKWRRQQQQLVRSGACAAAAPLGASGVANTPGECLRTSRLLRVDETEVEFILLPNPAASSQSDAAADELLLFFHSGLCGSDQLLASSLRLPNRIKRLLLPNRQGYLRSAVAASSFQAVQHQQPQQQRGGSRRGAVFSSASGGRRIGVYRHRLRTQASLFAALLHEEALIFNSEEAAPEQAGLHLLAVGEGCAHAVAFAHFFPQQVKSLLLLAPVFLLQQETLTGPVEKQILKRIQLHRQLVRRLPVGAPALPLPLPKLSAFEWLANGFSHFVPETALIALLHFLSVSNANSTGQQQQLLLQLQQQQPLLQQLLLSSSEDGRGRGPQGEQQEEAAARKDRATRLLLLRLQHLTGSCCLADRLTGYMEDALTLTSDAADSAAEMPVAQWLLQCLDKLHGVPVLALPAGGRGFDTLQLLKQWASSSSRRGENLTLLELPDAQPQSLLLTHAEEVNKAMREFFLFPQAARVVAMSTFLPFCKSTKKKCIFSSVCVNQQMNHRKKEEERGRERKKEEGRRKKKKKEELGRKKKKDKKRQRKRKEEEERGRTRKKKEEEDRGRKRKKEEEGRRTRRKEEKGEERSKKRKERGRTREEEEE